MTKQTNNQQPNNQQPTNILPNIFKDIKSFDEINGRMYYINIGNNIKPKENSYEFFRIKFYEKNKNGRTFIYFIINGIENQNEVKDFLKKIYFDDDSNLSYINNTTLEIDTIYIESDCLQHSNMGEKYYFHNRTLEIKPNTYGMEWELGLGGDHDIKKRDFISNICYIAKDDINNGLITLDNDPSATLELVFFPQTIDELHSNKTIKNICNYLESNNILCKNRGGIHLHTTKSEYNFVMLDNLLNHMFNENKNSNFFTKIANRNIGGENATQWALMGKNAKNYISYENLYKFYKTKDPKHLYNRCKRYSLANFGNKGAKTIEFRLFNTTREFNTIKRYFEFMEVYLKFIKIKDTEISMDKIYKYLNNNHEYMKKYKELYNFVKVMTKAVKMEGGNE